MNLMLAETVPAAHYEWGTLDVYLLNEVWYFCQLLEPVTYQGRTSSTKFWIKRWQDGEEKIYVLTPEELLFLYTRDPSRELIIVERRP